MSVDLQLADGSLYARFTSDGAIYMNGGQLVGRYDDQSGSVYQGTPDNNQQIGLLQRTNPPFRDALGINKKALASFCMNYRDLQHMTDLDGATIRPNNNPYSVEINNDGSIYVAGDVWGHVVPGTGTPPSLEPLMPFVAAVLIYFVPGVVLSNVQTQEVFSQPPRQALVGQQQVHLSQQSPPQQQLHQDRETKQEEKSTKKDKKKEKSHKLGFGAKLASLAKKASSSGGINLSLS